MRFLFVSPNLPTPPISGGAQRTSFLQSTLQFFGEVETVFWPDKVPDRNSFRSESAHDLTHWVKCSREIARDHFLTLRCSSLVLGSASPCAFLQAGRHRWAPHAPLIEAVGNLSRYDLVVARYLSSACILDLFHHPRLVIDVDDYDPDRLRQRIASSSWLKNLTLRRCLRFSETAHHRFLPRAAHCWISNPADRRHPGLANATLLPNIPYFPAGLPAICPPPPADHPPVFLIVGTLSYSANSDGIDAFLRDVWPTLRAQSPTADLHLVGQGMSPAQRTRWSRFAGVKPIGFVEDLAESYARCTATLAPIMAGGGTNIKVLESCAYGRPCVVSRVAHRGFERTLPDGEACLRAETISDMATACLRLLREPGIASRIGLSARLAIETHYTPAVFSAAVREGIERALQKPLTSPSS